MSSISKQLIHFLLIIAVASTSVLPLNASTFHKCEHNSSSMHDMSMDMDDMEDMPMDMSHCQQTQAAGQPCTCDNCDCDKHIAPQNNTSTDLSLFQFDYFQSEITIEIPRQYSQHFYNPLLRPPKA